MSFLHCMLFLIVIIIILINSISCSTDDIESATTIRSIVDEIRKIEKDEKQLQIDREIFEKEKEISKSIYDTDIIQLNVGGKIIVTTRQTLTKIPTSIFFVLFCGRWEHKLHRDQNGNIFLDLNPIVFRHLLDQLQIIEINNSIHFSPPSQSSLIEPFHKMLRKLGLQQLLSSEKKNVINFNIGGQTITTQRTPFTEVLNSTFVIIVSSPEIMNLNNENDVFLDYDPKLFQHLINQLRKQSFKKNNFIGLSSNEEKISFETMLSDLRKVLSSSPISIHTKWKQNGVTIADKNGAQKQLKQLSYPRGIYVDDNDQSIYITDTNNHRIVQWKFGANMGQVVAGGAGEGNRIDQLRYPTDVTLDKNTDSLIICDRGNSRVVQWSRQNSTNGQIIISDISCNGLTMDTNGDLYVSDWIKHEVRRWKIGEKDGIIVAGGQGGNKLNQLNQPTYLFVDEDHTVYVSDSVNNRVMKWVKGAKEGVVVAGGQGKGNDLTQLSHPHGVIVDHLDNVYVADSWNHRIMCWSKGLKEGRIIVGGNGKGQESNQFSFLEGLSFDKQGNLYVADFYNERVQKFEIDSS